MPRPTELIGPFPPGVDEATYDRLRRRVLWRMPTGLYLIGARAGSMRNFMTANLVTQVSTAPKLLGVAVETDAHTHSLIAESGWFSLNLLRRDDRTIVRGFARPATVDVATSTLGGERYRDAPISGAPVLERALAFVDCRVTHRLDFDSHSFFVGEVVDADFGEDGEDAEVLRMEDTRMNYGG